MPRQKSFRYGIGKKKHEKSPLSRSSLLCTVNELNYSDFYSCICTFLTERTGHMAFYSEINAVQLHAAHFLCFVCFFYKQVTSFLYCN